MTTPLEPLLPEQEAELRELLDAVCEERVTSEIAIRLEAALRDRPAAQQFYLRHLHLYGMLKWELGQQAEWDVVKRLKERGVERDPAVELEQKTSLKSAAILPLHDHYPEQPRWYVWSSIAATLLVATAVTYWMSATQPRSDSGSVAALPGVILAQAIDARWDAALGTVPLPGDSLPAGKIGFAAGLVRLDFTDGASVTLEGPAEFTIVNGRHGILHRGSLTAKAPPEAIGFRIDTPTLTAVDLGTVFGVQADANGRSEVQVFDGEVVVSLPPGNGVDELQKRTFAEGTAARVEPAQRTIAETPFDGSAYLRSWPVAYGVLAATGSVKFIEPKPFVVPRRHNDDRRLVVFPERESVVLERDLAVAVAAPGEHAGPFDPRAEKIPVGTRVRSFLMQFNPVGRDAATPRELRGTITFDHPIVGLICTKQELNDVDGLFATKPSWRPGAGGGVEAGDTVTLSEDRRTLTVNLTAGPAHDQLRVLVEAPLSTNVIASR